MKIKYKFYINLIDFCLFYKIIQQLYNKLGKFFQKLCYFIFFSESCMKIILEFCPLELNEKYIKII